MTIIGAGAPGYYGDIAPELAVMGRSVADVRARRCHGLPSQQLDDQVRPSRGRRR